MLGLFFVNILIVHAQDFSSTSLPSFSFPTDSTPTGTISPTWLSPISPVAAFQSSTIVPQVSGYQDYSPELLSCFGKLRLACAVNLDFNRALDKYVGSGRLDKIAEVLEGQAQVLCTPDELSSVYQYINNFEPAIQIAQQVTTNLSSADKDQLNFMENLNDTNAERLFYLGKFGAINDSDRTVLQNSFNEVMKAFASGTPAAETSRALSILTPDDLARVRVST
ncbi:hypothetical protein ANCCAN_13409 [Ancylostoma caninum]|uniref:Uncharacterized protein n=1 Tax=Ancylostoma caninum TaxID=29170 RepID=A0A368GBJ5_ANCCA|nr:hypothetical protein ANCCAN_13409 [Ancylostoma caninum]